jgi:hypothetical protein
MQVLLCTDTADGDVRILCARKWKATEKPEATVLRDVF